jgi:hypothetical protein
LEPSEAAGRAVAVEAGRRRIRAETGLFREDEAATLLDAA